MHTHTQTKTLVDAGNPGGPGSHGAPGSPGSHGSPGSRVALLADLVAKCQGKWSNTGQILIKYSSNIEQRLIQY